MLCLHAKLRPDDMCDYVGLAYYFRFLIWFCWFNGGLHLNGFIVYVGVSDSPNSLNCRGLRAICHSAQSSRQIALCAHPKHITHNDRQKIRLAWRGN